MHAHSFLIGDRLIALQARAENHNTSSQSRNPMSSSKSSFASKPRRPATANTSPFFESESPNGTQAAPIPIDDDDEDEPPSFSTVTASSNKRKRDASTFIISDDEDDKKTTVKSRKTSTSRAKPTATTPQKKTRKPKASPKKPKVKSPEKRLRPYRDHAPQTYQARYERALTQRMFLIDRQKTTKSDEHGEYEEEVFDMAGTTGNVYQVTISKVPKCTCPDWRNNRSQCKHIIYVSLLDIVLRMAERRSTANSRRFLSTSSNVRTIYNTSSHTCQRS